MSFAAAIDAIFRDPHMARDAIWRPGGTGGGVPVRAMRKAPDDAASFGPAQFVTDTAVVDIRIAEAPTLAVGDTIEIDGEVLTVFAAPMRDRERLVWSAEARPA